MKFYLRFILIILTLQASAQAQQPNDDVIVKAMQDELKRNMEELSLPNLDKPFFIMYGISDQKSYSIMATLGSIIQSTENQQRFKSTTRVLVGDYSFNDESLEDNLFSGPTAREINLPLDADYNGIRRSFWSATDKVYRDAARHFARHKETLKETGKTLKEIPHRSFAKSAPVVRMAPLPATTFNKTAWEQKARNFSSLFLKDPSIINSAVMVQYSEGYEYLVNSEGTLAKLPVSLITFAALCQSKNAEGEFTIKQIMHMARSSEKLPSEEQLTKEIQNMIADMQTLANTPKFDDEYSGPVLLMGSAVAELFSRALFESRESILANDNITPLTGFQFEEEMAAMDGKIGKSIFNEAITIKAKPKLRSYNGIDLLGSYEMDSEGIVPADEVVVVQNGVLKTLLNNRTLTHPTQTANGFSSGPGVLEITLTHKQSEKVLKEKLLAQAKKEGLDYAIIVRDAPGFGFGLMNVYKVYVKDGKEQYMRNAILNPTNVKTLKRILGASSQYQAHNLGGSLNVASGGSSQVMSLIVPQAVLLQEMDIQPFRMPSLKEEEYVSNPLK